MPFILPALPFITAAAAVIGAGVTAYSAIQAGNTAQKTADYNAAVADEQAQVALSSSEANAQQIAQQTKEKIGAVASAYGAGGVDVSQGTPLSVMSDLQSQGEMTRQLTLYQGKIQAEGLQSTSALETAKGAAAAAAAPASAFSTLLGGASSAAKNLRPYFGPTTNPAFGATPGGQGSPVAAT
jgi:hypothetical protein